MLTTTASSYQQGKGDGNMTPRTMRVLLTALILLSNASLAYAAGSRESMRILPGDASPVAYDAASGLTYNMSRVAEEEGNIRFFLKTTQPQPEYEALTPDQLNALEPAAGVQFHLKF